MRFGTRPFLTFRIYANVTSAGGKATIPEHNCVLYTCKRLAEVQNKKYTRKIKRHSPFRTSPKVCINSQHIQIKPDKKTEETQFENHLLL